MGTNYIRTDPYTGAVATTARYLAILTSPVTAITMTSGSRAMSIFNLGSGSLVWGGSNIAVNSGNYLFVNSRIEWSDVQDGFRTFVIADSVQTLISITEYTV